MIENKTNDVLPTEVMMHQSLIEVVPTTSARQLADLASLSLEELGYRIVPGNRHPSRAWDAFRLDGCTFRRDGAGQLFWYPGYRLLPGDLALPTRPTA